MNNDADTARRYYRTVLVVEVLGNERYTADLAGLSEAVGDGDYSGVILAEDTTEVSREDMAALLRLHGSDPDFLGAGEAGPDDEH